MFFLENKIIVITGSNSGIGLELAKGLISHKAKVIRIDKLFNTKLENSYDIKFNLKNIKGIKNLVTFIKKKFKRIDGLVNNAGITFSNSNTEKNFDDTIAVNLIAVHYLCKYICPIMAKKRNGSIINISSLNARFGFSKNPSYQISKAGVDQLTRSIAVDWGQKNIRCNNIVPGYIKTKMTKKSIKIKKKTRKRNKL